MTVARVEIQTLDLQLPDGLQKVGYIRGASDRVPEILAAVGVALRTLEVDELEELELSGFDAIVVGSRAYEVEPALGALTPRLTAYVRGGGILIVQYQQYQFSRAEYAALPLEIGRPHGRVTDETAPVRVLVPDHRVFNSPNPITDEDWQGWAQERGLYFAAEWDEAYTPLLALNDEGRPEEQGALLVAELGDGFYVYTGLSFFRQLPAGVPGALRLFVNLLSLGVE